MQKSVALTDEEQIEAFENAVDAIEGDVDDDLLDAEKWGGEVKDGEVVRILAEAWTGHIDWED